MNESTVAYLNKMIDDMFLSRRTISTVAARIMWVMPCQVRGQVLDHLFAGDRFAVIKGEIEWT